MTSQIRGLCLIAVALLAAGCSQVTCRPGPYLDAQALPPLVIPEGLDAPDRFMALRVPDQGAVPGRPGTDPDGCFFTPPQFFADHGEPNPEGLPIRPSTRPGAFVAGRAAPTRMTREITAFVEDWAEAWGRRNFEAWAAYYEPDFAPEGYADNATWRAEQSRLFEVQATTRIQPDSMEVTILPNGRVRARFAQEFGVGDQVRVVTKELILAPRDTGEGWMIVEDYLIDL